jgi:hypothetical protein
LRARDPLYDDAMTAWIRAMRHLWGGFGAALAAAALLAAAPAAAAPALHFTPMAPAHEAGAQAYRAIWAEDGARIIAALERAVGLPFPPGPIEVLVGDGPPMMAYDGRTMRLRAAYSDPFKRAALIHELGHALAFRLGHGHGLDDHRLLYLFLYDVWAELYGPAFAARMASLERRIPGGYDYDAAWTFALDLTPAERRARIAAIAAQAATPRLGYDLSALD